ncbi:hypothetical protein KKG31_03120 [Patescibacteria group bacterium]|nr:hypothetical protein [Patescibacteria group bacterium]
MLSLIMKNLNKKSVLLTTILAVFLLTVGMFVDRSEPTNAAPIAVN